MIRLCFFLKNFSSSFPDRKNMAVRTEGAHSFERRAREGCALFRSTCARKMRTRPFDVRVKAAHSTDRRAQLSISFLTDGRSIDFDGS